MPWIFPAEERPLKFWNLDSLKEPAKPGEAAIITEGEFDGIACIQAGMSRVVSVPNGAPTSEDEQSDKRFTYLYRPDGKSIIPELDQFRKVILAVDGDAPGQWLRDALARRIGDERCYWVQWPSGCKDANDLLVRSNEEELRVGLLMAKRMWNDIISTIDDIPDREVETFFTPISTMDLRIELPGFMVMVGPYSSGKSVFLRQFLWGLWRAHGWRFLLTCLEEPVKPRTLNHLRALEINKYRGLWLEDEIRAADAQIRQGAIFLQRPRNKLLDKHEFLDKVELAIRRDGVRVVALDPVNELDHDFGDLSETRYWGRFIMDCKRIADEYQILFICCGHPPKGGNDLVRQRGLLRVDDMFGSGNWASKSDIGMAFWKQGFGDDMPTMMHIEKIKDHETMGKPMLYSLRHISGVRKFEIADRGYQLLKRGKNDD